VSITRAQLLTLTREAMDADAGDRWSPTFLLTILDAVFNDEWSNILNAAPYYRFGERAVATDANGRVPYSDLHAGVGDSEETFYRILALYDGVSLYDERNYRDVPMAAIGTAFPQYPKQYYQVGEYLQILPATPGVQLTATVNWKPTGILDLAGDASIVDFPANNAMLLACEAAGRALEAKAGAEQGGAQALFRSAERYRADLLTDIARRSITPRTMGYSDQKASWAG
jgi:hypothetical protein